MRKIALILALAIALPAWAQADKAPAAAAAPAPEKPAAQPAPEKTAAAKAETSKKTMAKKHPRRFEDARHCLDEPSNEAIIKCAEAYL